MTRPATWKVVTVGAALTGLGVLGAGAAHGATEPVPASVGPVVEAPVVDWATAFDADSPDASFFAMDDSWDDSFDDSWDDSWDDTP
ncbi:hypothetical protein [Mycolicibacterium thermoresistibile]